MRAAGLDLGTAGLKSAHHFVGGSLRFWEAEQFPRLVKLYMAFYPARLDDPRVGNLGENLRDTRTKLGLTQEQVAERSGVQAGEVSRIEAGKRDPQLSTILKLAKAVEVPPGQLLE